MIEGMAQTGGLPDFTNADFTMRVVLRNQQSRVPRT